MQDGLARLRTSGVTSLGTRTSELGIVHRFGDLFLDQVDLQSDHPARCYTLATSDRNLQNKLEAVGLPFVELPDR